MSELAAAAGRIERRSHPRFRVNTEVLVFLGKDTGTIVDISKGGMSVHFAVFEQDISLPPHLDIFLAQSRFYLPKLPVSLVNEIQTLPTSLFSSLRIKRLGMKFGTLSREQRERIDELIESNVLAVR